MNLSSQLKSLNATQIKSLSDSMAYASMACESCGSHAEIFRRGKHRRVGQMRQIYEMLEHASPEEMENLSKSLAEIAS